MQEASEKAILCAPLAIETRMRSSLTIDGAVTHIDALEERLKRRVPALGRCFVEPDGHDRAQRAPDRRLATGCGAQILVPSSADAVLQQTAGRRKVFLFSHLLDSFLT